MDKADLYFYNCPPLQSPSDFSPSYVLKEWTAANLPDLPCRFIRITNSRGSALLARIQVGIYTPLTMANHPEIASALLTHVNALNDQLATLQAALQIYEQGFCLALDGLVAADFTRASFSRGLSQIAQDCQKLMAYAQQHNLQLMPTLTDNIEPQV